MKPIHIANCAASGPGIIWENARPCLYSSLVIQPRGTRSRCMYPASAIGPPKPNEPSFRKYAASGHSPTDCGFERVSSCMTGHRVFRLLRARVLAQVIRYVRYLVFLNVRAVGNHFANDTG